MPPSRNLQIQNALGQVRDEQSFFRVLLADVLNWPTADVRQTEEISYGWTSADLQATGLERHIVEGSIWQIQPADAGQPWGIFVLEFKRQDALHPRRGMAGVLRKVLRGLVSNRRKNPKLPSWKREHLLFICTFGWTHFRFAYFRSKPDESRAARLASFGWSPETPKRTVCEFNLPALIWPDDPSDSERWVNAWAKAFDKEPLTRDFFKRFDIALEAIKGDLEKNMELTSAQAYTQSQLLLERLIFLYFLQNRGWLNQDRSYLSAGLMKHSDNKSFSYYEDFLDRVFYTLSTPAGAGANRLPGIPFLNGGLFDDDEFAYPVHRRPTPLLKVCNRTMREKVFGQLLDEFNFTVTEDTPLNQDVAVDPEMLGKVFESIVLHAEAADPDAVAPDKRKSTGSYYTPRIVVHFICREVLYQYLCKHLPGEAWRLTLKTLLSFDLSDGLDEEERELLQKMVTPDQARRILDLVRPLKCCDPAVGSGAFPVGLMQELVHLRRLLETALNGYRDPVQSRGTQWLHEAKEHIVENCLFGVDIQQQAIEICRLRLWLSLIVDYDLGVESFGAERRQFLEAIERISQLPNLEMNFRRGDSLHDYICGVPVVILPDKASRHSAGFAAISKLGAELHSAKRAERKKKLRLEILEKRFELSRQIIDDELREIDTRDSALDSLFGLDESNTEKRQRNEREREHLREALKELDKQKRDLDRLGQRPADGQFYPKLRKLEGADFDSPFNFVWSIDFPIVFTGPSCGFDIVVGNPPFVTARNKIKRDLWAERWPRVCYKNYLLVCPFFELGFAVLAEDGQLGFIVSNAFAKRDFGKPLIQSFFPTVDLQKVVDCSGLMFPGHGTPTCIVSGRRPGVGSNRNNRSVRVTAILPGGGDLRTLPDESPLWKSIEERNDEAGYRDGRIEVSDRSSSEMNKWPWRFTVVSVGTDNAALPLQQFCAEPIGAQFITGKDDAFVVSGDYARRIGMSPANLRVYGTGEDVRDWQVKAKDFIVFPYDSRLKPLEEPLPKGIDAHLRPHKDILENCVISGSIKKKETNLKWFEYRRLARAKFRAAENVVIPQIATHPHFVVTDHSVSFKEKAQAIVLKPDLPSFSAYTLTGVLNSSLIADELRRESFSKRESSRPEKDTYFEFSGGKLASVGIAAAFGTLQTEPALNMQRLSTTCHKLARSTSQLALRQLFSLPGEAYNDWNSHLPGQPQSHPELEVAFENSESLRRTVEHTRRLRDSILARMIALQEEMDWLTYGAVGLVPAGDPAVRVDLAPDPLERDQRPFRLWQNAIGNWERASSLISNGWSFERRKLWEARLTAIRDNQQIRRVEQPLCKRRWDEQWKVGNQWRSGDLAYTAEFVDAFEWWLKEKAEWWLERKKDGGPVEVEEWTLALWKDSRVQAAWVVAAEKYALLEFDKARQRAEEGEPALPCPPAAIDFNTFVRQFKRIVDAETVPDGFPPGRDYDELEKKLKKEIPAKLKSVRGKLNVPRERFHSLGKGAYKWARLQFKSTC